MDSATKLRQLCDLSETSTRLFSSYTRTTYASLLGSWRKLQMFEEELCYKIEFGMNYASWGDG